MAEYTESQIKDKIKKLLKQSAETNFPEEAQTALLMAQKLLLKYKIDAQELTTEEAKDVNIIEFVCDEASNTAWSNQLAKVIAKNFGTMHFLRKCGTKSRALVFFGEEDKVIICKDIFDYTVVWLNKRACNYATKMRNTKGIVKGVKQDFILGFLKGLEDKFNEQVKQDQQMYALVVVVSPEVKSAWQVKQQRLRPMKTQSMTVHGLDEARQAGYQEGRNYNTGEGGMRNTHLDSLN